MKIRSDFVTNSSSSSYCVSFSVNTIENEKIHLNFRPDDEGGYYIRLKTKMQDFLSQLRGCTTVQQLRDFLLNAVWLDDLYIEVHNSLRINTRNLDNKQYLDLIAKTIEEAGPDNWFDDDSKCLKKTLLTIADFSDALDQLISLDKIQSVSICEEFSGWGEFTADAFEVFLDKALTSCQNDQSPDAVREALQPYLAPNKIEFILEQMEDCSIGLLDASIVSTLKLSDGSLEKIYDFHADNGAKWV